MKRSIYLTTLVLSFAMMAAASSEADARCIKRGSVEECRLIKSAEFGQRRVIKRFGRDETLPPTFGVYVEWRPAIDTCTPENPTNCSAPEECAFFVAIDEDNDGLANWTHFIDVMTREFGGNPHGGPGMMLVAQNRETLHIITQYAEFEDTCTAGIEMIYAAKAEFLFR